jgi:ELWxxDGT repeat protein
VEDTSLFRDNNPGRVPVNPSDSSDPQALTVFNNKLWFMANDGTNGRRWWTSDGTPAGAARWTDSPLLNPGSDAKPAALVIGTRMFFINEAGGELWQTDGTAAGTTRIYVRGTPRLRAGFFRMIAAGPRLYLMGWTGLRYELWTSDGTAEGTILLRSLAGGSTTAGIPDMAALGSRVVFASESPAEGREVWISDGTVAGTQLLRDLWPGSANPSGIVPSGFPKAFASLGDRVVFGALSPVAGGEPWITDGTTAGTQVLADLTTTAWASRTSNVPPGSSPDNFIAHNSQAWCVGGVDGRHLGRELRRWDRNREPYCVRDLMPLSINRIPGGPCPAYSGPGNASPVRLFGAGGSLYFRAGDPIYGQELFVSNGSSAGTRRLRNLSANTSNPASLVRAHEVVAAGFDGINARLLASGTGRMRSWRTEHGRAHGAPQNLVEFSNGIGFSHPLRDAQNTVSQQVFRWPDAAPAPVPVMAFSTLWRMGRGGGWRASKRTAPARCGARTVPPPNESLY